MGVGIFAYIQWMRFHPAAALRRTHPRDWGLPGAPGILPGAPGTLPELLVVFPELRVVFPELLVVFPELLVVFPELLVVFPELPVVFPELPVHSGAHVKGNMKFSYLSCSRRYFVLILLNLNLGWDEMTK